MRMTSLKNVCAMLFSLPITERRILGGGHVGPTPGGTWAKENYGSSIDERDRRAIEKRHRVPPPLTTPSLLPSPNQKLPAGSSIGRTALLRRSVVRTDTRKALLPSAGQRTHTARAKYLPFKSKQPSKKKKKKKRASAQAGNQLALGLGREGRNRAGGPAPTQTQKRRLIPAGIKQSEAKENLPPPLPADRKQTERPEQPSITKADDIPWSG